MLNKRLAVILAPVLALAWAANSSAISIEPMMRDLRSLGAPEAFEAMMLVCFSLSWPGKLARLLRERRTDGLSPHFLGLIFAGYVCGTAAKIISSWGGMSPPYLLIGLYAINGAMAGAALVLTLRYRGEPIAAGHPPGDSLSSGHRGCNF